MSVDSTEVEPSVQTENPPQRRFKKRLVAIAVGVVLVIAGAVTGALIAAADGDEPAAGAMATTEEEDTAFRDWMQRTSTPPSAIDSALATAKSNCALLDEGATVSEVADMMILDSGVPSDVGINVLAGMAVSMCDHHVDDIGRWLARQQ
ncbi:Protein of unknown function (DUF732) [Prauserella sp. Am3]|nr:Protein of unknown function (DUF732) [Prauserella sp. Am3]